MADLDVLGRDAELLGDDLRERRLVALALRLGGERDDRLAATGARAGPRRRSSTGPRMSMCLRGPAPTPSVKNDTPMPISSPRARFSACSRRRSS